MIASVPYDSYDDSYYNNDCMFPVVRGGVLPKMMLMCELALGSGFKWKKSNTIKCLVLNVVLCLCGRPGTPETVTCVSTISKQHKHVVP